MQTSLVLAASMRDRKSAEEFRNKGYSAQRQGNLDMALSYYQRAIQSDPSFVLAYNDIGVLLEARDITDGAKEAYLKAISLDPSFLSPYYNLAALYEKEGDLDNAVYYWEMRVNLGEWDDEWTWRAKDRLEKIDEEFARKGRQRPLGRPALKIKPDPKRDAQYHKFRGRRLVSEGDYIKAVNEFNAALLFDPDSKETKDLIDDAMRKANLY